MRIHINLSKSRVSNEVMALSRDKAKNIVDKLFLGEESMTGWVNWPNSIPNELFQKIEKTAEQIRKKCNLLIVIGIGGSYLGTAALLDALGGSKEGCPQIEFAGQNLSGVYQKNVADKIGSHDTCICVISKSGNTMETSIAYSILKEKLISKYGVEEALQRIVIITDGTNGTLRKESNINNIMSFDIPADIGGRYSVLTAVGLFPLAVAGIKIKKIIEGASEMADHDYWINSGINYALTRFALFNRGKELEIFEYYNPSLHWLGEWTKQLFGESEGKEGRGLFPVSLTLSTDLHSIGQYLQEGKQFFFETVINITKWHEDIIIPNSINNELAGKSLNEINQYAVKGVVAAHSKADIPIVQITLDESNEYCLGQLVYFFEMTAAITAKLMDVNPFTQDGVEKYKSEINKYIKILVV